MGLFNKLFGTALGSITGTTAEIAKNDVRQKSLELGWENPSHNLCRRFKEREYLCRVDGLSWPRPSYCSLEEEIEYIKKAIPVCIELDKVGRLYGPIEKMEEFFRNTNDGYITPIPAYWNKKFVEMYEKNPEMIKARDDAAKEIRKTKIGAFDVYERLCETYGKI